MADYLTKLSDSELANKADEVWAVLDPAPATYSATAAQATDLKNQNIAFKADLTAHQTAQTQARAKTQAKNTSRDQVETTLRFLIQQAKLNGATDEQLAELGVPVGAGSSMPSTATRPLGTIDTSQRFVHKIHFSDEASPGSKRNPRGVLGCEIWMKIGGAPPTGYKECVLLGLDTKTPYMWEFDAEDVGETAHYMLRWRFRDESTSDWSITFSATVTG